MSSHQVYSVNELSARLAPVFAGNGVRRAVLFGSHAKNKATPGSDVDILVDSGLCGLAFFGLLEDVCQRLNCPVDLLDVSQIIPGSPVDREIKATGVVIYEG